MDSITIEFINYYSDYLKDEDDYSEQAGDWACKYCDNQEHVNQVLDEIDEWMDSRNAIHEDGDHPVQENV